MANQKYKLVPVKPTPEMERAAESYWNERRFMGLSDDPRTWAGVYQAMLAAAPDVKGEPVVPEGFRLIAVNETFDSLTFWLDRCEQKGHLENCADLVEPWESFEYREVEAPQPAPDVAGLVEALEYLMGKYPASRHLQDTCAAALSAYRRGGEV